MVNNFNIVPSLNQGEPGLDYFKSLQTAAEVVVRQIQMRTSDALSLCEYLDCVDAGDLPNSKELYGKAVLMLTAYLDNQGVEEAHALAGKSWAAKTLWELICAEQWPDQIALVTPRTKQYSFC